MAYNNTTYIALLLIVSIVVFITWTWFYKINPYFKNAKLKKNLETHPEWNRLEETEKLLQQLYKKVNPYRISRKERKRLGVNNDELIYGEISCLSFFTILHKVNPQPGEIFYDLGCGAGKAVFTAAFFFDLSKSCGIELLPGLYKLANEQIEKARKLIKHYNTDYYSDYLKKVSQIEFHNENFLETKLNDANIIFVNATCLTPDTWDALINKFSHLQSGTRLIVNSKQIHNDKFKLMHQAQELMSWGMTTVSIYKIM